MTENDGARAAPDMTFAERLIALRTARGLTQADLVRLSGLASSHISMIESGERRSPAGVTVGKLARALGVSADELLG